MESRAADDATEAIMASVSVLADCVRRGLGSSDSVGADPLREQADTCLDGLAETARVDA